MEFISKITFNESSFYSRFFIKLDEKSFRIFGKNFTNLKILLSEILLTKV